MRDLGEGLGHRQMGRLKNVQPVDGGRVDDADLEPDRRCAGQEGKECFALVCGQLFGIVQSLQFRGQPVSDPLRRQYRGDGERHLQRHAEDEGRIEHRPDRELVQADEFLGELIYNSVISLIVGEKVMIEMPTFWFPSGAGVSPGLSVSNHGEPDPTATFRFAEPVYIEPQQNFRVEIAFPQGVPGVNSTDVYKIKLSHVTGPLRIWVVLDGYLTRDVQ